ncbi:hypothetical protein H9P43_003251 [Blastocladiella emersonii ATCC 22665]|nr:hypothetical protein H9P43_003251 [Blastocladiella emersonii ATCC 22665]
MDSQDDLMITAAALRKKNEAQLKASIRARDRDLAKLCERIDQSAHNAVQQLGQRHGPTDARIADLEARVVQLKAEQNRAADQFEAAARQCMEENTAIIAAMDALDRELLSRLG